ncbi:glycoside hydrolase N-terminal domain-containing protein, partial [Victivallis lenta]
MTNGQHLLFYRNPARCWEEALPLGNGRIGAMVYGRADEELIELNEDTLWGGRPRSFDGGGYFEQLGEARRLLRERRFAEADEFISSHMLHYDSEGYLPAGRLKLRFAGPLPDGEYRRELELSKAVAATRTGGLLCEWFVSAPHQVLVMRCTATVPGTAGFALSLDSPLRHTVGIEAGDLFLNGVCPVHARGDEITETDAEGRGGIRFEIRARLLAEGGTVAAGAGALTASGADSILLLVAIRSDFRGWNREPAGAFPAEACRADLDRAAAAGSDALRSAHIEEHQLYYRRSSLELPEDAAD